MFFSIKSYLAQPQKIFLGCLIFIVLSLVFNGVLWRLWGLHRDLDRYQEESVAAREEIVRLKSQLEQAKDPSYIEQQATDRFDLAGQDDLVFVFPTQ